MERSHQKPSKALSAWLDRQLEILAPGSRLPSTGQIARTLRISHSTVVRLLSSYASRGLVVRIQGRGTFLPQSSLAKKNGSTLTIPTNASSIDHLHQAIHRSIWRGEIKKGEVLPSVKFICSRYGVSSATVTATYRRLVQEGQAVRVGRSYRLGTFAELAHDAVGKEVYLFYGDETRFGDTFANDPLRRSYTRFEEELSACGFVLRHEPIEEFAPLLARWVENASFPYGVVLYYVTERDFIPGPSLVLGGITTLLFHRVPVLVDWGAGLFKALPNKTLVLSRPNMMTSLSRAMARQVSTGRLTSLVFFADNGNRVRKYPAYWWQWEFLRFRAEVKHLNPGAACLFVVKTEQTRDDLLRSLSADTADRLLSKYTPTSLVEIGDEIVTASLFTAVYDRAYRLTEGSKLFAFTSSAEAAKALDWAQSARISIPGDLSMIVLDSDPRFYHRGISRLELDWDAIGYLMAHAIIQDFVPEKTAKGYIRTTARIIHKLTTRWH